MAEAAARTSATKPLGEWARWDRTSSGDAYGPAAPTPRNSPSSFARDPRSPGEADATATPPPGRLRLAGQAHPDWVAPGSRTPPAPSSLAALAASAAPVSAAAITATCRRRQVRRRRSGNLISVARPPSGTRSPRSGASIEACPRSSAAGGTRPRGRRDHVDRYEALQHPDSPAFLGCCARAAKRARRRRQRRPSSARGSRAVLMSSMAAFLAQSRSPYFSLPQNRGRASQRCSGPNRADGRVRVVCHEHRQSKRRCATVREMKEGPSRSAVRCWSQTTASCCRQKRWW